MDRDSSVGIATRYALDGPGIESRWGRDFPHPSRPALRPTQPPVQWVQGLSRGVKWPGSGADHPPPSNVEVEGRVELHICSPSGPSWPILGRTLPLPLTLLIISVVWFLWNINYFRHTINLTCYISLQCTWKETKKSITQSKLHQVVVSLLLLNVVVIGLFFLEYFFRDCAVQAS